MIVRRRVERDHKPRGEKGARSADESNGVADACETDVDVDAVERAPGDPASGVARAASASARRGAVGDNSASGATLAVTALSPKSASLTLRR